MEFLASDAMNGRGSGTRDEWIAASYIASQLRRWGLEPLGDDGGFVQAVEIARTQVTAPPVLTRRRAAPDARQGDDRAGPRRAARLGPAAEVPDAARRSPAGAVVLMPEGPISRDACIAYRRRPPRC